MTASLEHSHGLYYRLTERILAADVEGILERQLRRDSASDESLAQARRRLGDQAWEQALQTARDVAYQNALQQSGLRAVSEANFCWAARDPGADCVFTATFEVLPSVDVSGLNSVEIGDPVTEITDTDVTHALEILRNEHKNFVTVTRAAQLGDRVMFGFEGTVEGTSFEGGSGKTAAAVLGTGDVLDDMDTALIGRRADEVFDTRITFPHDYAQPSLRGQTAAFNIAVHSVAAPELPELDFEFVRRLGVESGSLDTLRKQVRKRLESECARVRARYRHGQLTQALLEAVPLPVPESLLHHELERVRATFERDMATQQPDAAGSGQRLPEKPLKATAERRVKLSLILSEIIRSHDIRLDQKRVEKKIDELASKFAQTDTDITKRQYRDNPQVMHNVQALVIEEQGFEAALKSVRKKPVAMNFDALLQAVEE